MVFLQGDHTLDTNITVADVTRLMMRGESSLGSMPTVVCSGPVGFSFTSMMDFKIHSLAFTSCSRDFSDPSKYALLFDLIELAELVNCSFHDNHGTALVVIKTTLILTGNTTFTRNHCEDDYCVGGGGIAANSSKLTFIGDTMFFGNNATFGNNPTHGAAGIDMIESSLTSTGNIHFINNTNNGNFIGYGPLGAIWASASSLHFTGTNNFINNSADNGIGVIGVTNTSLSFTGSNTFNYNSGILGGAIYAECDSVLSFSGTNTFTGNSGFFGGAIFTSGSKSVNFTGTNIFYNNSAGDCGAIATFPAMSSSPFFCGVSDTRTVLDLTGTNNFSNNSADSGGTICTLDNSLILSGTSNINSNSGEQGGAIFALNAILRLNGTVSFTNNKVNSYGDGTGGGMYLYNSTVSILSNTTVYWEHNHAILGGAIYVDDSVNPFMYCTQVEKCIPNECFFQLPGQNLSNGLDIQLVFKNNSADDAGSVLYGGV